MRTSRCARLMFAAIAVLAAMAVPAAAAASEGDPAPGSGDGLYAEYFDNKYLAGTPAFTAVEAIDVVWGDGAPAGLGKPFSVRWSGEIEVPASGDWTFTIRCDDGMAVFI